MVEEIINVYGFPTAVAAGLGYAVWRVVRWIGLEVLPLFKDVVVAHRKYLEDSVANQGKLQAAQDSTARKVGELVEATNRQTVIQEKIAAAAEPNTRMLEEIGKTLKSVCQASALQCHGVPPHGPGNAK